MPTSRPVPAEPLGFIQECVRRRRILWTHHVNMRLHGRSIRRDAILNLVDEYEVIESYPQDKYLPSYLILVRVPGDALHVLFAADVEGDTVRVVTAYRPDGMEWLPDLKTRRIQE